MNETIVYSLDRLVKVTETVNPGSCLSISYKNTIEFYKESSLDMSFDSNGGRICS